MLSVMKLLSIFIKGGEELNFRIIASLPNLLLSNDDNELQVQATICLKNFIRVATPTIIKKYWSELFSGFTAEILKVVARLIEVPKDKSFEAASLYAGNLIILTFNNVSQEFKLVVGGRRRLRSPA